MFDGFAESSDRPSIVSPSLVCGRRMLLYAIILQEVVCIIPIQVNGYVSWFFVGGRWFGDFAFFGGGGNDNGMMGLSFLRRELLEGV